MLYDTLHGTENMFMSMHECCRLHAAKHTSCIASAEAHQRTLRTAVQVSKAVAEAVHRAQPANLRAAGAAAGAAGAALLPTCCRHCGGRQPLRQAAALPQQDRLGHLPCAGECSGPCPGGAFLMHLHSHLHLHFICTCICIAGVIPEQNAMTVHK